MKVDKGWFMLDTGTGLLVLQRLGFFGDNHLKRTTNSYEIWRNILHFGQNDGWRNPDGSPRVDNTWPSQ